MKNKYRYRFLVHVYGLVGIVFIVLLMTLSMHIRRQNLAEFLSIICILVSVFGLINNLSAYCYVTGNGIYFKSIIKCINMELKEIHSIKQIPGGRFVSTAVLIDAYDKQIIINSLIKDYKRLLKDILDECEKNKEIRIEPMLYNLIKD